MFMVKNKNSIKFWIGKYGSLILMELKEQRPFRVDWGEDVKEWCGRSFYSLLFQELFFILKYSGTKGYDSRQTGDTVSRGIINIGSSKVWWMIQ